MKTNEFEKLNEFKLNNESLQKLTGGYTPDTSAGGLVEYGGNTLWCEYDTGDADTDTAGFWHNCSLA